MSTAPPQQPPAAVRRPPPRRYLLPVLLLVTVLALATQHVTWRVGNARAVARLEKAACDRGEPITLAELAATYPPIPDSSNAYVALVEIWRSEDPVFWDAFEKGLRPLPEQRKEEYPEDLPVLGRLGKIASTNRLNPASLKAAEQFLNTKAAHLAALRTALKRPGFRPPIAFEEGYEARLPWLPRTTSEVKLFQVEAIYAGELGRVDQAIDSISDSAKVSNLLNEEPWHIGQLVRIACFAWAVEQVQRLLSQHQLEEVQLDRLAGVISDMAAQAGLKRMMIGERTVKFSVFDLPPAAEVNLLNSLSGSENGAPPRSDKMGAVLSRLFGWQNLDKRLMGETFQRLIQIVGNPDYATNNQVQQVFEDMTCRGEEFPPKSLTMILMPSLQKASDTFARYEAFRRCALITLAIERSRLRHSGTLPKQLADLPPESLSIAPTDPFDGKSMRYIKQEMGYVVYSIGPDREDNGGQLNRPKKTAAQQDYDVGFRVERPAR